MPIKEECKYSYLNILGIQYFVQIFIIKKIGYTENIAYLCNRNPICMIGYVTSKK